MEATTNNRLTLYDTAVDDSKTDTKFFDDRLGAEYLRTFEG